MAADMWRVPASVVRMGDAMSVIEDRGMLQHAPTASNGNYLFTEVGAGVKPLALIGLWHEVLNFIAKRASTCIENRIGDLPEIYLGACFYRPGQRFVGLFPVQDAIRDVVNGVVGIAASGGGNLLPDPSGIVGNVTSATNNVVGAVKDGKDALQPVLGGKPKTKSLSLASNEVYLKFGYLPEKGMKQIGNGSVDFGKLHDIVRETLSAMV